jgi:hypothetical protein
MAFISEPSGRPLICGALKIIDAPGNLDRVASRNA